MAGRADWTVTHPADTCPFAYGTLLPNTALQLHINMKSAMQVTQAPSRSQEMKLYLEEQKQLEAIFLLSS